MNEGASATAAILSVGDELVLGTTLDTNSQVIAQALRDAGFSTLQHRTVADDLDAIVRAMRDLVHEHDALVVTGGLGPTDDDLTREALNVLLDDGAPMLEDAARRTELHTWFEGRGRPMPAANARQVLHPRSARTLPNPHGTAPGLAGRVGGAHIFCLPGPPREMQPMLASHVLPVLARAGQPPVAHRAVCTFGLGESSVAALLGERLMRGREPAIGTTASQSIVTVQIVARGGTDPEERAVAAAAECARLIGPYAYGGSGATLAGAVVAVAMERGVMLAVAESCTAGLVGAAIGAVPGASACFAGGWLTYSNAMKERELGVPAATIRAHGAVSAPCAAAMAEGAVARAGAGLAIAVTGIAGPTGGSADKPVGTVYIALSGVGTGGRTSTQVHRFHFPGARDVVRDRAAKAALQLARWRLAGVSAPLVWETTDAAGGTPGDARTTAPGGGA